MAKSRIGLAHIAYHPMGDDAGWAINLTTFTAQFHHSKGDFETRILLIVGGNDWQSFLPNLYPMDTAAKTAKESFARFLECLPNDGLHSSVGKLLQGKQAQEEREFLIAEYGFTFPS